MIGRNEWIRKSKRHQGAGVLPPRSYRCSTFSLGEIAMDWRALLYLSSKT
jgi:hypothetical protein